MQRESLHFDIVIVGAGPAGLACAIRLSQLAKTTGRELSIGILEKGATVGAHILSGAVLDPIALNELLPEWQQLDAPLYTPATDDHFLLLTAKNSWRLPTPPLMKNHGNYVISLDKLCRWLGAQAENLGVQIFPGFPATEILYTDTGAVCGVRTGDKGIDNAGQPTDLYQPGIDLYAKQTVFAEGCRGSLTKTLLQRFNLTKNVQAQTYGIGVKELWEVAPNHHQPGKVMHTIGWPLDTKTYGGSFLYHLENHLVAVGFVVGLDYSNPFLDPYEELQRFKTHPAIRDTFENAKRIAYGARALNEGGWQSIPKLSFPGGLLIGDSAGFLNVPRIKGIHTSMKSGMIAAEAIFTHIDDPPNGELSEYPTQLKQSWIARELYAARNIRPAFRWGLWPGLAYAALDTYVLHGKAPWTLQHPKPDYLCLKPATVCTPIQYPKHDGVLTFDKLTSVFLSNTLHNENQPCHLQLKDPELAIAVNFKIYASPESRYCPAAVYEILDVDTKPRLQINFANCIHCKTCDIKDPRQNINWVPPEGGDGPNYTEM
ncbi:MAG TPA: electron transfer flavoprotein-ubiquinone oxidoreductase [Gammaproteobacteria bacterium]|nr:electron transfer flavoprotein-ubiquinone oxidoreductase [Gammaproteobacteria bacterium]